MAVRTVAHRLENVGLIRVALVIECLRELSKVHVVMNRVVVQAVSAGRMEPPFYVSQRANKHSGTQRFPGWAA